MVIKTFEKDGKVYMDYAKMSVKDVEDFVRQRSLANFKKMRESEWKLKKPPPR